MSNIKECFVSRFKNGKLMIADFSQLEIYALMILSGDARLKADLESGRDLHRERAASLFNKADVEVTKQERTIAKQLSFQLQYGAGAASMAQKNNIPKELAKKFIDQFYTRYPKVKAWQEGIRAKVDMCRVPTSAEGLHGLKIGKSVIQSLTGRMYTFFEYANKEYNRQSFSPTEVINYPVQGFATGDIVPAVISELRRQLILFNLHKKSLMIMTVHDSIILDCEEEAVEETAYLVSSVCNLTSKILSKYYGIEIDQTFPIEITVGPNLLEQTHYEVSNG